MDQMMKIPILGIVENMSDLECPDCDKKNSLFGESHIDEIAKEYNIPVIGKLPIDPKLAGAVDEGLIELFDGDWLDPAIKIIEDLML